MKRLNDIYNVLDEKFVLYVAVILFTPKFFAKVKFLRERGRIIGNVYRINLTVTLALLFYHLEFSLITKDFLF